MPNHPNRGRGRETNPAANPAPDVIRAAREGLRLTLKQAAAVVYRSERNWHQWEIGERRMDPAVWELFRIKTELARPAPWRYPGRSARGPAPAADRRASSTIVDDAAAEPVAAAAQARATEQPDYGNPL